MKGKKEREWDSWRVSNLDHLLFIRLIILNMY